MKTMKFLFTLILSIMVLGSSVEAVDFQKLTDLGASARMIGRANIIGFDSTATAINENPAAMGQEFISVSAFNTTLVGELGITNIGLTFQSNLGRFGLGYTVSRAENLFATKLNDDNIIEKDGELEFYDKYIKFGYQYDWDRNLSLGINMSVYAKDIGAFRGQGSSFDLGALYRWNEALHTTSLVFQDVIGDKVTYTNGLPSEDLPIRAVLGHRFRSEWGILYAQANYIVGKEALMSAAIEREIPFAPFMEGRIGLKEYFILDEKKSGMTLGLGLNLDGLNVDYAYESGNFADEGYKHYLSLSFDIIKSFFDMPMLVEEDASGFY